MLSLALALPPVDWVVACGSRSGSCISLPKLVAALSEYGISRVAMLLCTLLSSVLGRPSFCRSWVCFVCGIGQAFRVEFDVVERAAQEDFKLVGENQQDYFSYPCCASWFIHDSGLSGYPSFEVPLVASRDGRHGPSARGRRLHCYLLLPMVSLAVPSGAFVAVVVVDGVVVDSDAAVVLDCVASTRVKKLPMTTARLVFTSLTPVQRISIYCMR